MARPLIIALVTAAWMGLAGQALADQKSPTRTPTPTEKCTNSYIICLNTCYSVYGPGNKDTGNPQVNQCASDCNAVYTKCKAPARASSPWRPKTPGDPPKTIAPARDR
jgi:hypothetical protein